MANANGGELMSTHEASLVWRRGAEERFTDGRYSRAHEWMFDGGARVRASASPNNARPPYSDPSGVDPEEALVAALSSCHMLFFLWLSAQRGFAVLSYEDAAIGVMSEGSDGRQWVSKVTLRPRVVFDGGERPTAAEVEALHHDSHDNCYIANSVKTQVLVEGKAAGTP
jgi:organic hydroperoxide reductase OsmC/OhrA